MVKRTAVNATAFRSIPVGEERESLASLARGKAAAKDSAIYKADAKLRVQTLPASLRQTNSLPLIQRCGVEEWSSRSSILAFVHL